MQRQHDMYTFFSLSKDVGTYIVQATGTVALVAMIMKTVDIINVFLAAFLPGKRKQWVIYTMVFSQKQINLGKFGFSFTFYIFPITVWVYVKILNYVFSYYFALHTAS